jgi:hypothetical protein
MAAKRHITRVAARANLIERDIERKALANMRKAEGFARILKEWMEELYGEPLRLSFDHGSRFILIARTGKFEPKISLGDLREAV